MAKRRGLNGTGPDPGGAPVAPPALAVTHLDGARTGAAEREQVAAAYLAASGATRRPDLNFRALSAEFGGYASALLGRHDFARRAGLSFYDATTNTYKRNLYSALGYEERLTYQHYMSRYMRGGIAETIVDAYPQATWAGGAAVITDPDPNVETPFERAVRALFDRLDAWTRLTRADILCGLDVYSALIIGAAGDPETPLPDDLSAPTAVRYLLPRGADQITILSFDTDVFSERYGLPDFYSVKVNVNASSETSMGGGTAVTDKRVHWSRVIHVADGVLADDVYGKPRLRAVWNYLDDLEKIVGGGAEASWKRMDPGLQIDLDPEMALDEAEENRLNAEVDEYINGLRRVMRTRGGKVTPLATQVAGFGPNAETVIKLISATSRIPYSILTGLDHGEFASVQARLNWGDRIAERRRVVAEPLIRQLISRFVDRGALPAPPTDTMFVTGYGIEWVGIGLDMVTKSEVVAKLTGANQNQRVAGQPPVVTTDEVRQIMLDLGPLDISALIKGNKEYLESLAASAAVASTGGTPAQPADETAGDPKSDPEGPGGGSGPTAKKSEQVRA